MPDIFEECNEQGFYFLDACYKGTVYIFDAASKVKILGGILITPQKTVL